MLAVIAVMVPLTIPRLFGYQVYGVLTGSMTPAYPVGSVVYVKGCDAASIKVGDAITFQLGSETDYVMTHRVVGIDEEKKAFLTKGDANDAVDSEPVEYRRLIGKVVFSLPAFALVSGFIESAMGKAVLFACFAGALALWLCADILKKRQKQISIRSLMLISGIGLVAGALIYLGSIYLGYSKSTSEYEALRQTVFAKQTDLHGEETGEGLGQEDKEIMAAIGELRKENADVIGWIHFDTLPIDYPIMQTDDNEYYLKHTFSGEVNSAGSIFMEAANTPDFDDSHTILYGHNMKNNSMFGSLKKYKNEDFYIGNEYFTVYTADTRYRYQIFAYYDISQYGDVYQIGFAPDEEFQEFIHTMCRRSYYDTGVTVQSTDKILTLSTCSSKEKRFVVHAKRIEEQK